MFNTKKSTLTNTAHKTHTLDICLPFDCVAHYRHRRIKLKRQANTTPPSNSLSSVALAGWSIYIHLTLWVWYEHTRWLCPICSPDYKSSMLCTPTPKTGVVKESIDKREESEHNVEHTLSKISYPTSLWTAEHLHWNKPTTFKDSGLIPKAGVFLNRPSFHFIIGNTATKCGNIKQKLCEKKRFSRQCRDPWAVVEGLSGQWKASQGSSSY